MAPGFVPPHLSLEFLAKAGMFHPQLPNLAGKLFIMYFHSYLNGFEWKHFIERK